MFLRPFYFLLRMRKHQCNKQRGIGLTADSVDLRIRPVTSARRRCCQGLTFASQEAILFVHVHWQFLMLTPHIQPLVTFELCHRWQEALNPVHDLLAPCQTSPKAFCIRLQMPALAKVGMAARPG